MEGRRDRRASPRRACTKSDFLISRPNAPRSPLRHPRLTQALRQPVPIFDIARISVLIDVLRPRGLPRRHRPRGAVETARYSLERFMGLQFLARQGKRHDEILIRRILVRTDLDRTAGPFDRLIILFQCEMGARLVGIPCRSKGITLDSAESPCRYIRGLFGIRRVASLRSPSANRRPRGSDPGRTRVGPRRSLRRDETGTGVGRP